MRSYETKIINIIHPLNDRQLQEPAKALRSGELVAFPTETVYGLGADALNEQAVLSIFAAKGRPADNPLIVHIPDIDSMTGLVSDVSEQARRLFAAFSPGPLTLILPKGPQVPDVVTAGLNTVAVRIPAHETALKLLKLAGVPVAAPSANRSGRPSPTRARHVYQDFEGRIPYIIDDGPCVYGLESTVLDLTGAVPVILRPGAVSAADIYQKTGIEVLEHGCHKTDDSNAPRSPGMKYRHYAPRASVLIAYGDLPAARASAVSELVDSLPLATDEKQCVRSVGLFICGQTRALLSDLWKQQPLGYQDESHQRYVIEYGADPDPRAAAEKLFSALRKFDQFEMNYIIAEALPETDIGRAYMNRLTKAAGGGLLPEN